MVHPEHDCEDCGKTHFAWSLHKEHADKRKTRNIGITIVCVSFALIPIGLTVFDLVKDPLMLSDNIEVQRMTNDYDLACYSDYGMQYCLLKATDNNYVNYNSEKIVLQPKTNPCLNIYLETPDKITDTYVNTNSSDINCVSSLEFPISNGWSWSILGMVPYTLDIEPNDIFYKVMKSKQWWDTSNCPEENKFCNWWLKL